MTNVIEFGDCRTIMKRWIDEGVKVQTCITSPPYYGLRDYGTATWIGGDSNCEHKGVSIGNNRNFLDEGGRLGNKKSLSSGDCIKCGAVRQDQQIGLEREVADYVANIVDVFRHVWHLLDDDGTVWLNLGDSYAGSGKGPSKSLNKEHHNLESIHSKVVPDGLKPKDLIGIPWRVAFALQDFGWYLRQDIIWHKPNPMPESVTDRCTKAHEYIFLLSKSPKYYFDNESIKEPVKDDWGTRDRTHGKYHNEGTGLNPHSGLEKSYAMANKRSVWSVTTKPFVGAHFATFPPDLIEPCVLAGTSRKGHCPKCNARWEMVKKDTGERADVEVYTGEAIKDYEGSKVQNPSETKRRVLESMSKVWEHEWVPTCDCGVDPVPDVVLDPFMGSGTTAAVAQRLNRHYLGCELNTEYKKLQDDRLKQPSLELL
jgi:DNA modification methylase